MLNIKYIEAENEIKEQDKFVCSKCHGVVFYRARSYKVDEPEYIWQCENCSKEFQKHELKIIITGKNNE